MPGGFPVNAKKILIEQIEREFASTRKVLAAVPDGRAEWQPHQKSMKLGRLAAHIAEAADWGVKTLSTNHMKLETMDHTPKVTANAAEALALLDEHASHLLAMLAKAPEDALDANWKMSYNGQVYVDCPCHEALQTWVINHMIHHRGQLTVYLRLLGVKVPGVYGPSADEQ
jgi:uncharacterized damage-inducible protein DinB